MPYAVKELFYTLQGEGANAGRAAVFLRFSGCNLWSGRQEDRHRGRGGCARWCDTDFVGTDGGGGGRFDTPEALARRVAETWGSTQGTDARPDAGAGARPLVVCTGGEPLLQLDAPLVAALHAHGFEIAIETNGTILPPDGIDWICVSPKQGAPLALTRGDELKLVFPQEGLCPEDLPPLDFTHRYLQPLDNAALPHNTQRAVEYCLKHPRWRLSLQTHKLLGIP
jgi:7-carboxy-7-deazaguanine synthase